jgi:hypothetical protein
VLQPTSDKPFLAETNSAPGASYCALAFWITEERRRSQLVVGIDEQQAGGDQFVHTPTHSFARYASFVCPIRKSSRLDQSNDQKARAGRLKADGPTRTQNYRQPRSISARS